MRRRAFNLTVAVSLAMCLAMVGVWVRSYWGQLGVCFGTKFVAGTGQTLYMLSINAGGLVYSRDFRSKLPEDATAIWHAGFHLGDCSIRYMGFWGSTRPHANVWSGFGYAT